jgi:uncharacterized membrane protein
MGTPVIVPARRSINLDQCLREGWNAVMSDPTSAFVGFLIYLIFFGVILNVPSFIYNICVFFGMPLLLWLAAAILLCWLLRIFLQPPFSGGLNILFLNLLYRRRPSATDVFAGFKKYGRFLGAFLLLGLLLLALLLPGIVILQLARAVWNSSREAAIVRMAAGIPVFLGGLVAYIVCLLRWMFAPWIIADDWEEGSVITAFKRSAQITLGHRLNLFLVMLVLGLIGAAGLLACCVGVIFTVPIAGCATAAVYNSLKGFYCETTAQGQAITVTPLPPSPQGTP